MEEFVWWKMIATIGVIVLIFGGMFYLMEKDKSLKTRAATRYCSSINLSFSYYTCNNIRCVELNWETGVYNTTDVFVNWEYLEARYGG
jgi:hypothetical protein